MSQPTTQAPSTSRRIADSIDAAIRANPRCAICDLPVESAEQASYLPAIDRVVHVGDCAEVALKRLVARLERLGRLR